MKRELSAVLLFVVCAAVAFAPGTSAQARRAVATVPDNAVRNPSGGWSCNDGFIKRQQGCVAVAKATDAEIRQQILAESLASYSGSCPCPYNTDRAGRRCGGRSAYSRPGGASPLCYASDVSSERVKEFRSQYPAVTKDSRRH